MRYFFEFQCVKLPDRHLQGVWSGFLSGQGGIFNDERNGKCFLYDVIIFYDSQNKEDPVFACGSTARNRSRHRGIRVARGKILEKSCHKAFFYCISYIESERNLTFSFIRTIISNVDAGWSSLEARRAHNPKVTGSNPVPATKSIVTEPLESAAVFFFVMVTEKEIE